MIAAALTIAAWRAKSESQLVALYIGAIALLYVAFLLHFWFVLLMLLVVLLVDFARGDEWFGKQRRGLWEEPVSLDDTPSNTPN
jgi:hypothetical protein